MQKGPAVVAWFAFLAGLTVNLERHVPKPYMDEIFHVPQTQKYCNGTFDEWDPMITTLPGLYVFAVGFLQGVNVFLNKSVEDLCTTLNLRLINCLFGALNFYIICCILRLKRKAEDVSFLLLETLCLSSMPLLFFFNTMYYTDVGSTFLVLYSYYCHLCRFYPLAGIAGILSMLFRQTNIIWLFFMGLLNVIDSAVSQLSSAPPGRKLKGKPDETPSLISRFSVWRFVLDVIATSWPYVIAAGCAVAFVLMNGSIVVGDKTAHEACFHPVQVAYFSLFMFVLSIPHLVSVDRLSRYVIWMVQYVHIFVPLHVICLLAAHYFTLEHQYLLADNRHITFYLWRKVMLRHWAVRYALSPVYVFAGWSICDSIRRSSAFRAALFICIFTALAPQKLLELRYFILPYLLVRFELESACRWRLLLELAINVAVNLVVFYIFLFMPIFWPNESHHQMIMW